MFAAMYLLSCQFWARDVRVWFISLSIDPTKCNCNIPLHISPLVTSTPVYLLSRTESFLYQVPPHYPSTQHLRIPLLVPKLQEIQAEEKKDSNSPSRPPVNLTVISLSMYFPRSRIFSFLGFSRSPPAWVLCAPPRPPPPPPLPPPSWLLPPRPPPRPPLPPRVWGGGADIGLW